jgi:hypothetical protein
MATQTDANLTSSAMSG